MNRRTFTILAVFLSIIWMGSTGSLADSASTLQVEFPSSLHFLNPAGDDVEVRPGNYNVDATESWLKLVPEGEGPESAVLVEAAWGTHEETVMEPVVRLEGESGNPDIFHLAMLRQDGTGLEAIGTISGIRPRGGFNLAFMKKSTPKRSTGLSRFRIARPQVGSGKQAPTPRPQQSCGPVTSREIGHNLGESGDYLAHPTLAVFRSQVHLLVGFRKRGSWTDYIPGKIDIPPYSFPHHYVFNGREWSPQKEKNIPGNGREKVALAVYNRNLWAVWRGKDKQLWFSRYYDQWAPPIKIPGQYSKSAPAIAVRRRALHMVHNGKSSDDLWHSTFTPRTQWTKNVKIGQKSRTTPGFTLGSDGNLHMVYLGAAKRGRRDPKDLWYSQFNGSRWTTFGKIQNQYSKASPTLLGAGTTSPLLPLLMVHLGKSENTLWHALYGKNPRLSAATQQNRWGVNERLLRRTSEVPVGLTFFHGCIHLVHKEGKKLMHTTYTAKDVHSGLP